MIGALAQVFNASLSTLDLSQAAFGAEGATLLAKALAPRGGGVGGGNVGGGEGRVGVSLGRVQRAVEADLCQEACVALDSLLADCEKGLRADPPPMSLCTRVLGLCQKGGKGKPALRLVQRMELCGMKVGAVALRQTMFACCTRGMLTDALALMSRRDDNGRRYLGKDVLVRSCTLMPGGPDGELGLALLEGALRGGAGGGWEVGRAVQIRMQLPVQLPKADEDADAPAMMSGASEQQTFTYPEGSFFFVCDDVNNTFHSQR